MSKGGHWSLGFRPAREAVRILAPGFFVMCPRVLLLTEIPPLLVCASLTFISSRPRSEQSLVRWATPQLHDIDALARMVDPALKGIYPAKSLSRFADIVALCVQVSLSLNSCHIRCVRLLYWNSRSSLVCDSSFFISFLIFACLAGSI